VAEIYISKLSWITEKHGHTSKQVSNVSAIELFWKKTPNTTFTEMKQTKLPGHKPSKDKLNLLLEGNDVEYSSKPTIFYHFNNPKVLKGILKS
jgi:hypothetical protein